MRFHSTGRLGLLSSALLLAASPAIAGSVTATPASGQEKPPAQDQQAAKQAAKKQAAMDEKRKAVELQKKQGKARGDVGKDDHQAEMLKARYGGEVDENAKLDVEFGSENFRFGKVTQGEKLQHTFVMKAGGTSDLVIRQAKPTCGCTVSEVLVEKEEGKFEVYAMGDPISPGKQVKVTAEMDTKNKSNKAQVRINVYTNDPVGLYQFGLEADVEPFMTVQPSYLNLGDLAEETVREEKITVRTSHGQKIKLAFDESLPRPKPPGMDFILAPVRPDEEGKSSQWEVTVKIGPGLVEGPVGYSMRLVSDVEMPKPSSGEKLADGHSADDGHDHGADDGHGHGADDGHGHGGAPGTPQFYRVNANVGGRVLGVLSVSPQYLSMGLVRPGQPVSRSVRIVSNDPSIQLGDLKARVQGAAGSAFPWSEHFTPIVRPVEGQAQAVEVELRLDGLPEGSEGSFKGEMVLETGSETKPEMKVTFSGVCRAGVGRSTKSGGN